MDLFQQLRYLADKRHREVYDPGPEAEFVGRRGMECVIEALQGMMVGEPMLETIYAREEPLFEWGDKEYIEAYDDKGKRRTRRYGYVDMMDMTIEDYEGTDGEEVYVVVLKGGEKLVVPEEPLSNEEEK